MPHHRRATYALAVALAATLAACSEDKEPDVDRPRSFAGSWIGRGDGGALAGGQDSIALTLSSDASATVRRWSSPRAAAHFDSTAHYALWKVTGSKDDRTRTICLHLPATGANDCIPISARGGDSLRLAFPTRPSAPGAVVDVTLQRVAVVDSTIAR